MITETRRCEWCGEIAQGECEWCGEIAQGECEWCAEIAQGECGCAAETEIARLREDAERYRWLRSYRGTSIDDVYMHGGNEELDAAIDAARKDTK